MTVRLRLEKDYGTIASDDHFTDDDAIKRLAKLVSELRKMRPEEFPAWDKITATIEVV